MQCNHCKKELQFVNVFSEAKQLGKLDGTTIVEYSHVTDEDLADEASDVECPECHESIMNQITNL